MSPTPGMTRSHGAMHRRTFLFTTAAALAACSDYVRQPIIPTESPMTHPPPGAPAIVSITVNPSTAMVPRGGQAPFMADCMDSNGMHGPPPPDLVWSVDSAQFGSVGPQGLFWDNQPYTAEGSGVGLARSPARRR